MISSNKIWLEFSAFLFYSLIQMYEKIIKNNLHIWDLSLVPNSCKFFLNQLWLVQYFWPVVIRKVVSDLFNKDFKFNENYENYEDLIILGFTLVHQDYDSFPPKVGNIPIICFCRHWKNIWVPYLITLIQVCRLKLNFFFQYVFLLNVYVSFCPVRHTINKMQ